MAGLPSLAALEGEWALDRSVFHTSGDVDRLHGMSRFRRVGHRIVHDEEGRLTLAAGPVLRATRRYLWSNRAGWLDIAFADNRPFHSIPLGEEKPRTVFLCGADRYAVSYDFSDPAHWKAEWLVSGPRKDYRMVSLYSRA